MAGRAQTRAVNCLASLRLFLTWYIPVTKLQSALSAQLRGAPAFQNRTELEGMHLEHQPLWSPHALSNSADATSTVNCGQAIASSNGFVMAADPIDPQTAIHWA
jgi:hypothetical protein